MKLFLSLIIIGLSLIYFIFFAANTNKIHYEIEKGVYNKYKYEVSLEKEPIQKKTGKDVFTKDDYTFKPLYDYAIKAKVLGKEKYRFGAEAKLSSYDLALGWKAMSRNENIERIKITQSNRWYRWRVDSFFIPKKEITHNSANTHIIHANQDVLSVIESVDEGDIVELYGYLVNVSALKNNRSFYWNSSTKRTDVGGGACEVFYVNYAKIQ